MPVPATEYKFCNCQKESLILQADYVPHLNFNKIDL